MSLVAHLPALVSPPAAGTAQRLLMMDLVAQNILIGTSADLGSFTGLHNKLTQTVLPGVLGLPSRKWPN